MTSSPLARFVRQAADADVSDADLVQRFADTRCEGAFTELVRRHGPTVYGVCRRGVGDHHLAEDAFQAVFVVLARRAAHIRPPGAVGGWLFGVARKVAAEANMRKRRRETPTASLPDRPQPAAEADDTAALVEAAIAELPDPLRAAVLACEIEGLSRKRAAARLGIPEGTLSSRLAAARKRLGDRLRPRAVLTVAVPATLAAAAISRADGQAEGTVLQLTNGVLRAMSTTKLRLVPLAVALAAVVLAVGAVSASPPEAARNRYQIKAPVPKDEPKEGKILFWLDDKPQLLKPDGTELDSPDAIKDVFMGVGWGNARLSPDGKRVAFERSTEAKQPVAKPAQGGVPVLNRHTLLNVLELEGKKELKEFPGVRAGGFYWMGDGTTLFLIGQEIDGGGVIAEPVLNWTLDTTTQKRALLTVPKDFVVRSVSRDGKVALAEERKITEDAWHEHYHLWTIGTDKPTPLLEKGQSAYSPTACFSPDGKRLMCKVVEYGTRTPVGNGAWSFDNFKRNDLVVVDLATKKQTVVKEMVEDPEWRLAGFAWSPDGKKIAYVEYNPVPQVPGKLSMHPFQVMVADTDGKNAKQIYSAKGHWMIGFDWR